ncbi:MAG: DUF883 family protein [Proteobacteria bacterium]|nr:DUF883 family protein [Pseudomonadota bacterium]
MNVFAKSNSEKLIREIKSVVADAEALLRSTKGHAGAEVAELHASMTHRIAAAKSHLVAVEEAMLERARLAAKNTDECVHDNPWQFISIAAGVGLLVGYLIHSSRDCS